MKLYSTKSKKKKKITPTIKFPHVGTVENRKLEMLWYNFPNIDSSKALDYHILLVKRYPIK